MKILTPFAIVLLMVTNGIRQEEERNPVGEIETPTVTKKVEKQQFPVIDAAIAKLRDGKELTKEEIEGCEAERQLYYDKLTEKNGTGNNTEFAKSDQCDCYIVMIKMALINFPNHGGWPFRSSLRLMVAEEFKKRAGTTNDPFIHFCSIFPSLSRRDVKAAVASYQTIRRSDPFLADIAAKWAKGHLRNNEVKTEFMQSTGLE